MLVVFKLPFQLKVPVPYTYCFHRKPSVCNFFLLSCHFPQQWSLFLPAVAVTPTLLRPENLFQKCRASISITLFIICKRSLCLVRPPISHYSADLTEFYGCAVSPLSCQMFVLLFTVILAIRYCWTVSTLVSNGSESQQWDDSRVLCTCRSNRGKGWGFSGVTTLVTRTYQFSLTFRHNASSI
jgi:hypothetical protein